MSWFDNFEQRSFEVNGASINARFSRVIPGDAIRPALLLLHGFPQSHVMWHRVAQRLAAHYFLVMPDLRGYGDSAKAPGQPDHGNYSKRSMAGDMVAVMQMLGIDQFYLCGHDRGGRAAHRLALDHGHLVRKLCVIDIAPTLDMYEGRSMTEPYLAFARAYYHWFHMLQPAPRPEIMMGRTIRKPPWRICMPSSAAGAVADSITSSRKPWPSTSAAFAMPRRCTPLAKTTGPAAASTWTTTGKAANRGSRWRATCWCSRASAGWSIDCSIRWRYGMHSATAG